ncbi:uncharacterized protein WM277_001469 [Molossus nigricans]
MRWEGECPQGRATIPTWRRRRGCMRGDSCGAAEPPGFIVSCISLLLSRGKHFAKLPEKSEHPSRQPAPAAVTSAPPSRSRQGHARPGHPLQLWALQGSQWTPLLQEYKVRALLNCKFWWMPGSSIDSLCSGTSRREESPHWQG